MSSPTSSPLTPTRIGIIAALVGSMLIALGWAVFNETPRESAAASFDGEELTFAELNEMLASLPDGAPVIADGSIDLQAAGQVIRQWAATKALAIELESRGAASTDIDEAEGFASAFADPSLQRSSAFGQLSLATSRETTALDRYTLQAAEDLDFSGPEFLCARHILVGSLDEANEVSDLLAAGADFSALAVERSLDGSAFVGGDLGCEATALYVPEFSDGARRTGVGVSDPIESPFGWHIISVRSIGPLSLANHPEMNEGRVNQILDDARVQAEDAARQMAGDEVLASVWSQLSEGLVIDPRFGSWDESSLSVLLPAGVTAAS